MSFDEKDGYDKVGSNGIQASSGPAYGADAVLPKSDPERDGGVEGFHDGGMSLWFYGDSLLIGPASSSDGHVNRTLKERHLSMIALGGAIGTGDFVDIPVRFCAHDSRSFRRFRCSSRHGRTGWCLVGLYYHGCHGILDDDRSGRDG
jgi:hypothetical protein